MDEPKNPFLSCLSWKGDQCKAETWLTDILGHDLDYAGRWGEYFGTPIWSKSPIGNLVDKPNK